MVHAPEKCPTQIATTYRSDAGTHEFAVIAGAVGLKGCPERGITVDVGDEPDPPVFHADELLTLVAQAGDALYASECTSEEDRAYWLRVKRNALGEATS